VDFLVKNYMRQSVVKHNHTLTATSVCHYFEIEDADKVSSVQKILRGYRDKGYLKVLDTHPRYSRNKNRPANLYLIMEYA
jgi:hypothetical protein